MKRKLLAIGLSLMLLISLMVPAAYAAEEGSGYTGPTLTVTTSATEVRPGDVIDCSLVLGPVTDLLIMAAAVDLPDGLTFVPGSGQLTSGLQQTLNFDSLYWDELNYKGENNLLISGYGSTGNYTSTEDTVLLTFQCEVDEDASGVLSIGLTRLEFYCGIMVGSAYYDVTNSVVVEAAEMTVEIPVTGVTVSPGSMTLSEGESAELEVSVEPENATSQSVIYSSSDTDVATVDGNGTVYAVSEGEATITVTTEDGGYTASCVVAVSHEHTYGTDWSYDGNSHWHTCTSGDGAKTEESAHSGGSATCETQAVCEICGASYGDYSAHALVKTEAVEAGHNNTGNIEYWTCTVCGKLFSDGEGTTEISREDTVIPAVSHDYGTEWIYDEEQHWRECGCGAATDVGDHTFAWVVDKTATEEETGLQHEECTVCGYARNMDTVIPQLEHELTYHEAAEATCAAAGNVEYYSCSNCGRNFADAEAARELDSVGISIDPDNHTGETQLQDAVEATCTENGYTGDVCCADCGALLEAGSVIPAAGHTLEYVESAEATHSAAGNTEYWRCTVCGALFSDAEGVTGISAEDVVIPQISHTFGEEWISDETGHWHMCECGATSDAEEHSFGEWITIREAAGTETGSRERTCSICGYVETEEIASLAQEGESSGSGSGSQSASDTDGTGSADNSDTGSSAAQTGDNNAIGICLAMVAASGTGMAILAAAGRKKRGSR